MINNYEINNSTLAIIPIDNETCKILESEDEYLVNKSSMKIIEDSCKYFGSSYKGRFEGSKCLLGMNYKLPIIIEETRNIIFFPTTSPKTADCFWISLNNIKDYKKDNYNTYINFINGKQICLSISYFTLENQILRASRLEYVLKNRKMS